VYFWEYGAGRALRFAHDQMARGKVKVPAVVGAVLQLGECFDLLDTDYTHELATDYPVWEAMMPDSGLLPGGTVVCAKVPKIRVVVASQEMESTQRRRPLPVPRRNGGEGPSRGAVRDANDKGDSIEWDNATLHCQDVRDSGLPLPENAGETPDHKLRRLDCAVFNWLFDTYAERAAVYYDSVRGGFSEGVSAFPGSGIQRETHVQVAIRNPACILGVFRPTPHRRTR